MRRTWSPSWLCFWVSSPATSGQSCRSPYFRSDLRLLLGTANTINNNQFYAIVRGNSFFVHEAHANSVHDRVDHTPAAAIWQLFLAFWTWRRQRGFKSILLALPVILLALISVMAFAAAGILSARVTTKVSDVLIKGTACGFWVSPDNLNSDEQDANAQSSYTANYSEDMGLASTMATTCQKNSFVASDCVSYAPTTIEWTTTTDGPCPFGQKICYQNTTVRFDSGLIDTTKHLGINAQKQDRLLFRQVVECTPLVSEGYVSDWHHLDEIQLPPGVVEGNVLRPQPGEWWIEYFYGPNLYLGMNSTTAFSNSTPTIDVFGLPLWSIE
jgi:hypothetical protein